MIYEMERQNRQKCVCASICLLRSKIKARKKWQRENEIDFLDLNLALRIKQKDEIEGFLLSNENSLRNALNLPTYDTYKEFKERDQLMLCGGCRLLGYCSIECQAADWTREHANDCTHFVDYQHNHQIH